MTVADLDEIIAELHPHLDHPDPVIALLVKSVREIATDLRSQKEYAGEQANRLSSGTWERRRRRKRLLSLEVLRWP